ncbi:hypothetical protein ACSVHC_01530 [Arthrobacter sp. KNU-44]|uniref:hypothetical protein n=1 Tax=Arthrobacter sp. KNU-44 TaxID=3450744 RepID=UPI003F43C14D
MTESALTPLEVGEVRPGDQVVISVNRGTGADGGVIWHHGTVDEVALKLNIIWIRDSALGERKMFDAFGHRYFRPAPQIPGT